VHGNHMKFQISFCNKF